MGVDYFDSNRISLFLSWLFCVPIFFGIAQIVVFAFRKHTGAPWAYSAWVGVCFLFLSPVRYLAFLVAMAASYPFQTISAAISLFEFWLWAPAVIAFGLLHLICLVAPLSLTIWIAGINSNSARSRIFVSALTAPIAAFLGTLVFSFVLPVAAISTHGLDADAVIKATNGPAKVLFLSNGAGMIALPPYFSKTPETMKDRMRGHVALLYLSDSAHDRFLKIEYPNLYNEFHEIVMKL